MDKSEFQQICESWVGYFALLGGETIGYVPGEGWDLKYEGQPDILIRVRELALHNNSDPPRFVLVPRDATLGYVDQPGGQKDAELMTSARGIRRRLLRIQTYCWGANFAQAEAMLLNAYRAFENFHNAIDFADEVWETEQPGGGGPLTNGVMVSFYAIFDCVVLTTPQPMRRVTSVQGKVTELDVTETITL